jgi:molybdenum cofactor cytidylyltransferase
MNESAFNIGIIILAAGSSRRLGQPKQWLSMGSSHLLGHTVQQALATHWRPVVVVAAPALDRGLLPTDMLQQVHWVQNDAYEEGMASSVRAGIGYLQQQTIHLDAAAVLVCDQPFIRTSILLQLAQLLKTRPHSMAACGYAGRLGTPAIFCRQHWPALLNLQGDTGARTMLANAGHELGVLPFEEGAADIDTWEDYEKWVKNNAY